MAIELSNRIKILAGVVVLAAAGAGAWFFFLEDFLSEPPPKPAAAKRAAADTPKQVNAAKPAADAPKQADSAKPAAETPQPTAAAKSGAKPIPTNPDRLIAAPAPIAQKKERPVEKPVAASVPAAPVEAPGYQRPGNIRDVYSRYNDVITATVMRDRAAVKELLDDGKNPNARQTDGLTPLMVAAANGDTEIASMLLAKGADPNLRAGGRNALSMAKTRGSAGAGMVQLLERSGAKD